MDAYQILSSIIMIKNTVYIWFNNKIIRNTRFALAVICCVIYYLLEASHKKWINHEREDQQKVIYTQGQK